MKYTRVCTSYTYLHAIPIKIHWTVHTMHLCAGENVQRTNVSNENGKLNRNFIFYMHRKRAYLVSHNQRKMPTNVRHRMPFRFFFPFFRSLFKVRFHFILFIFKLNIIFCEFQQCNAQLFFLLPRWMKGKKIKWIFNWKNIHNKLMEQATTQKKKTNLNCNWLIVDLNWNGNGVSVCIGYSVACEFH